MFLYNNFTNGDSFIPSTYFIPNVNVFLFRGTSLLYIAGQLMKESYIVKRLISKSAVPK